MEILSKKEEKLLDRTFVNAEMQADIPPARDSARQAVASSMKVEPKLVVIKKIAPTFGERKVKITAYVYKSEERLKEIESPKMLAKGKKKSAEEKEKPAEKAAETVAKE